MRAVKPFLAMVCLRLLVVPAHILSMLESIDKKITIRRSDFTKTAYFLQCIIINISPSRLTGERVRSAGDIFHTLTSLSFHFHFSTYFLMKNHLDKTTINIFIRLYSYFTVSQVGNPTFNA